MRSARIPISPSLIADQYPIGVRTRMFAAENLGRPAGLVLGPFFVGAVAGWAGGAEGWRWAMVAVAIPALVVALWLFFLREPERGQNEQEAVLGRLLDASDDPPVRLSAAAARLRKVKSFSYLILGIGVLGFALGERARAAQLPARRGRTASTRTSGAGCSRSCTSPRSS